MVAVELDRAVEELLQRRMLHRTRSGYAFATPLMREAAYAGVGKADLAERHAALARWAAPETPAAVAGRPRRAAFTETARDDFVAEHVERAATLADAVRLRPDAPARAVVAARGRRAGPGRPPALSRRGAGRSPSSTPSAPPRWPATACPPADRLVHARALLQVGRAADALAYAEKIAANAGDDAATRAGALLLAGQAHQTLGDQEPGRAQLAGGAAGGHRGELPTLRASAMRRLGHGRLHRRAAGPGEQPARRRRTRSVSPPEDPRGQAWSLQNLAWVTTTRGDFAGTDAVLGRAARLFAELKDPYGRAWLRGTTAFARLLAGRLREARRLAQVFLPFGERVGEAWAVGTLRAVEAFATAELGDLAEADRAARQAYREFAAVSDDWGRGFALVVAGRGGARAGRAGARRRPAHRRAARTASGPRTRC